MKVTAFTTRTRTLIYVKIEEGEQVTPTLKWNKIKITHFVTDNHFLDYLKIRKEIPNLVTLFDTRRDLKNRLEIIGRYI